jgi:D-methionine transport system substrate-binding protein
MGIYSTTLDDLKDIKEGATILVPDDVSNQTRALLLLQQEGLIVLPEDASVETAPSVLDIVDAKGYNVQAAQADTVPSLLKNSDKGTIAVINYNYALDAGFKTTDALAIEDAEGNAAQTYANLVAVRRGDEDRPEIKALVEALQDGAVDTFNENTGAGIVAIK